jgi:hypothetical protein
MPRDLPIGNGSLLITFDAQYCLRDLYFPNVGHENNTLGHPCHATPSPKTLRRMAVKRASREECPGLVRLGAL